MQDLIAGVQKIRFDLEVDVLMQKGARPLPFPGMDKSGSAVCEFFSRGLCKRGAMCPFRHLRGEKSIVCKHWLRGLCKKGDQCEFLHEYDMSRMPECFFYSKFSECSNKECPFLHIDPASKVKDCPWYDRGFCKHGPLCKHRHTRRVICPNYSVGFCPKGAHCKFVHPKADLPTCPSEQHKHSSQPMELAPAPVMIDMALLARHQNLLLQEITPFPHLSTTMSIVHYQLSRLQEAGTSTRGSARPIHLVTCYKCGEKGHYANKCGRRHQGLLAEH
ncbi:cleavage and polyadenylation specificity factor subunit 4-like isoform X1 [Acipenser ruthenus]|uniref:cleavage and polyadenylation specificity factor subunit 4-like isoform X1 n=1 Tax=Acipenser ruthenus TaxID=7906 RepID=UPI002742916D|nr:cleavage and polyadenylation specificity factor subunit 4-like isoform X1 [Acipenser ruthenus]